MKQSIAALLVGLGMLILAVPLRAEEMPEIDWEVWVQAQTAAKGKINRGAGLAVLGGLSVVPTAILIDRAVENPQKYLAWSIVMGITTIGMTGHGLGSVGFGLKQKRQALAFIDDYDQGRGTETLPAQQEAWLYDRRKSAVKVALFGSVLVLQSAVLFTNGIYYSVQKSDGAELDDIQVWPSYLVGGLLLPMGVFAIVASALKYKRLKAMGTATLSNEGTVAVRPWFHLDPQSGTPAGGLNATWSF